MLKLLQYIFHGSYSKWDRNWEQMLDELMYNFCMDRSSIMQFKNDEVFRSVFGKVVRRSSMVNMIVSKNLGSYGNEASLQKICRMMGIYKGAVNHHVTWACSAILKLRHQVI